MTVTMYVNVWVFKTTLHPRIIISNIKQHVISFENVLTNGHALIMRLPEMYLTPSPFVLHRNTLKYIMGGKLTPPNLNDMQLNDNKKNVNKYSLIDPRHPSISQC